jgi:CRISPR-associated endonuclease/helicase Cas3
LLATQGRLEVGQRLTKADLTALTNEVYDEPVEYSQRARDNAQELFEDLRAQWLIVPEAQIGPDDTEAAMWQSRMIGPQIEVFVTPDPLATPFESRAAFEDARLRHTVTLPRYRLQTEPDRFRWVEVEVEDEIEQVLVLTYPQEYTIERGLI